MKKNAIMILAMMLTAAAMARGQSALDAQILSGKDLEQAGRFDQAADLYRSILSGDPDNSDAYVRLMAIADRAAPAISQRELARLAVVFPEGTRMRQTAHYLILYNTPDSIADSRGSLLELSYQSFYRQMTAAGWKPLPVKERLIVLLFGDYQQYLRYSREVDHQRMEHTGGYYSHGTNRIALFGTQSSPALNDTNQRITQLEKQMTQLEIQLGQAAARNDPNWLNSLRNQRNRTAFTLAELRNQQQRSAGLINISQTYHEATHQIAFNSNIQSRLIRNPFWFSEGLATCFETIAPAQPYGPAEDNPLRRVPLFDVYRQGGLTRLSDFVAEMEAPAEQEIRGRWYAQAWGLFHWLYVHRGDQLRQFRRIMLEPGATLNGQAMRRSFEKAFGPVETVEAEWLKSAPTWRSVR